MAIAEQKIRRNDATQKTDEIDKQTNPHSAVLTFMHSFYAIVSFEGIVVSEFLFYRHPFF